MPRINQGNMVPLFDNFSLADSWAIDTKAEIDAMVTTGNGQLTKLKVFNTFFDVTHGVASREWALGGRNRGGCVSCHSSADPKNGNYSSKSAAFFEGYQQPINNAGMGIGQFDLGKELVCLVCRLRLHGGRERTLLISAGLRSNVHDADGLFCRAMQQHQRFLRSGSDCMHRRDRHGRFIHG